MNRSPEPLVVCAATADDEARATALADALGLPLDPEAAGGPAGAVVVGVEGVGVTMPGVQHPFRVDFVAGREAHRRRAPGRDAIVDAIGVRRGVRRVLDVGAGFCRDAFVLASAGCSVTAIEYHPIVAALVRDALDRARADAALSEIVARIDLVVGDAGDRLRAIARGAAETPDTVYLDPMFPPRRKSASVKREAAVLQWLASWFTESTAHASASAAAPAATPAPELLSLSRGVARRRVVVKRPRRAEPLSPGVIGAVSGRAVRWDIYPVEGLDPAGASDHGVEPGP